MRSLAPNLFCENLRLPSAPLLLLALMLTLLAMPVLADEPFDLESSSWMSFDRYKEQPATWMAPEQKEELQAQPVVAPPPVLPPDMPLIKETIAKPIEAPVMPSFASKGFQVKVESTEDDNHALQSLLTSADQPADIQPDSKSWKNATEVAQSKNMTGDDKKPVGVRMSYLPAMWQPAPAPKATPVPPKVEVAQAKVPPPAVKPQSQVDPAVCAALDAYKKQQLAAIQSDRQTLAALQSAIAQLGLQNQLAFMPGADGSLKMGSADGMAGAPASAPVKN